MFGMTIPLDAGPAKTNPPPQQGGKPKISTGGSNGKKKKRTPAAGGDSPSGTPKSSGSGARSGKGKERVAMSTPSGAGGNGKDRASASTKTPGSRPASAASKGADRVKVAVRVRPFTAREKRNGEEQKGNCLSRAKGGAAEAVVLRRPDSLDKGSSGRGVPENKAQSVTFELDHVYMPDSSQADVFADVGEPMIEQALAGFNCSVFAYGQTGAGKSYTMMGTGDDPGIIPRFTQTLFRRIGALGSSPGSHQVEVSYLEIYNERLSDLLRPDRTARQQLRIRESKSVGVFVEGLAREAVEDARELDAVIADGDRARVVAATKMNDSSSRSHAIVTVRVTSTDGGVKRASQVHLVDLAGSERQSATGAVGTRLKEACAINKSLSTLGKVISALAVRSKPGSSDIHVPYRDSVLTRYLGDSLGGNAKTVMLTAVSPAASCHEESLSTLRYADRARHIVNRARVNEDPDSRLVRELKETIDELRSQLRVARDASQGQKEAEIREKLAAAEGNVHELERSWNDKVEQAGHETELRAALWQDLGLAGVGGATGANGGRGGGLDLSSGEDLKAMPRLVNLNEDPAMSEKLIYVLRRGKTVVGRRAGLGMSRTFNMAASVSASQSGGGGAGGLGASLTAAADGAPDLPLTGSSVQPHHCDIDRDPKTGKVTLTPGPSPGAQTFINGVMVSGPTELTPGCRVVIGSHHIFRYIDPSSNNNNGGEVEVVDWEFAARELSQALGDMSRLKDEADERLEKKTREAARLARELESAKSIAEKELAEKKAELERQAQQLAQERSRAASGRGTRDAEFSQREAEIAETLDTLEAAHQEHLRALEEQLVANRDRTHKVASMVLQREKQLQTLEGMMVRALQGVREANCVVDELALKVRFDVLTQSVFSIEADTAHAFVTVLLSRTHGARGSILLEEEELLERFDNIREIYDEYLETGEIRETRSKFRIGQANDDDADADADADNDIVDPFDILDERELLGWSVITFRPEATGDTAPLETVHIIDPVSREIHGDLLYRAFATPSIGQAARGSCEITVELHGARDMRTASNTRCIFRILGDDLHETEECAPMTSEPTFGKPTAGNDSTHAVAANSFAVSQRVPALTTSMAKYLEHTGVTVEVWGVPLVPRFAERPSTAWSSLPMQAHTNNKSKKNKNGGGGGESGDDDESDVETSVTLTVDPKVGGGFHHETGQANAEVRRLKRQAAEAEDKLKRQTGQLQKQLAAAERERNALQEQLQRVTEQLQAERSLNKNGNASASGGGGLLRSEPLPGATPVDASPESGRLSKPPSRPSSRSSAKSNSSKYNASKSRRSSLPGGLSPRHNAWTTEGNPHGGGNDVGASGSNKQKSGRGKDKKSARGSKVVASESLDRIPEVPATRKSTSSGRGGDKADGKGKCIVM